MYSSNEIFDGFTDRPLYQISTTLFILLIMLTIALIVTRLHGTWLIYDAQNKEDEENEKAYEYIHMNTPSVKKKDIFPAVMLCLLAIFMIFYLGQTMGVVLFFLAAGFILRGRTK